MPKERRFKSDESYRNFLNYEHYHHLERKHGPYPLAIIAGREHRVNHRR